MNAGPEDSLAPFSQHMSLYASYILTQNLCNSSSSPYLPQSHVVAPANKKTTFPLYCALRHIPVLSFNHPFSLFLSLSLSTPQAPPWYYHKKRYPPSYGPDGKPRSRVNNVQLIPAFREGDEESEEEVHLLNGNAL